MPEVIRGMRAENVRQAARHELYVEGKDDDIGFDRAVVREILADIDGLRVRGLGAAHELSGAAMALSAAHPSYYFLIDRDHRDVRRVQQTWTDFPDPEKGNLLIWPRRELESYFIDPAVLIRDDYPADVAPKRSADEIRSRLLRLARQRVFLDIANQVIAEVREELRSSWIAFFKAKFFDGADQARAALVARPEFGRKAADFGVCVQRRELEARFDRTVAELLGGAPQAEFGSGDWLGRIRAKPVFSQVVNECFVVRGRDGAELVGPEKMLEFGRAFARFPAAGWPEDFRRLHETIAAVVKGD